MDPLRLSYWFLLNLILITLALVTPCHNSTLPDESGGYSIVLGFDESIPPPENQDPEVIIQNIKTSLESFSAGLWDASQRHFYIKSVDILVPSNWTVENTTESTNQTYTQASIRITSTADRPYAFNPNTCGKPGQYVELPLSFFATSGSGSYGPPWKALLNLWATYRWGVHEEHGYVGDSTFPYAYPELSSQEWLVTGCSDQGITGSYITNSQQPCSVIDTLNASSSCRFVPDGSGQTATTSLMHFHWVESIASFCNESNHNRLAPNRQNAFCDYRSVWEVIRETQDYMVVTAPVNTTVPQTEFKIVKHNPKPILYILLDRGQIQGPLSLALQIPRALINFLGDVRRLATVAAVSSFSSENGVRNEIPWTSVGDNFDQFLDTIGNLQLNGSLQRDFSQAIAAAINEIKVKGHTNQVVMLVVKYGADLENFGNYLPESDIIHALNEQGVVFNSIELTIPGHSGVAHLNELAKMTGGLHTVLTNYGEAQTALSHVFNFMHKILDENESYMDLRKNFRTVRRTPLAVGSPVFVTVPNSGSQVSQGRVQAYFSTFDGSLSAQSFEVNGVSSTGVTPLTGLVLRKHQDWLEEGSKWSYLISLPYEKINPYTELGISSTCTSCTLLVRTDIQTDNVENVTISIFTSLEESAVDLSNTEPPVLFAKIMKSGATVNNAQVTAIITEANTGVTTELSLSDNGGGSPDTLALDGTYSEYFVPARDGTYHVSVVVRGLPSRAQVHSNLISSDYPNYTPRLLPVDQGDMDCIGARCNVETLPSEFLETVELPINVLVSGTTNYAPAPTKINSLYVTPDGQADFIRLNWFAPSLPGLLFSVSSYDIRQSSNKESLINDFENQAQVPIVPIINPGVPGSAQFLRVARPTSTTYYAIRSSYRQMLSKISNIEVHGDFPEAPPTIPTTESSSSTTTSSPVTGSTSSTTDGSGTGTTESGMPISSTSSPRPEEEKPWAKKPVGIAVITIAVIIAVAIIVGVGYFMWTRRNRVIGKITPPSTNQPRGSIPQ